MYDIIQFHKITSMQYKAASDELKTDNKIFYLSDTNEIYVGAESITNPIEWVEEFPSDENCVSKKIYINKNTLEGRIYRDGEWSTIIFTIKNDIDILNTYCPVSGFAVYEYTNTRLKEESIQSIVNSSLLELVYPIGSVYISTNSINPSTLFGFGTWNQIQDKFLLAAGSAYSAGSTGGEATHKLTVSEMPAHTHNAGVDNFQLQIALNINSDSTARREVKIDTSSGVYAITADSSQDDYNGIDDVRTVSNTGSTGSSTAHNNMPPYIAVYIWYRVS